MQIDPKSLFDEPAGAKGRDLFREFERPLIVIASGGLVIGTLVVCLVTWKWEYALNAVIGFAVGLAAALLAAHWYRHIDDRPAQEKLYALRSLAPREYLQSIVSELAEFRGQHCENYYARVRLSRYPQSDQLFVCKIHYEYLREVSGGSRQFTFRRIRPNRAAYPPDHTPDYLNDFFDWENDERDFPAADGLEEAYRVDGFAINGQQIDLERHATDTRVTFTARVPTHGTLVKIEFTVTFPIESESVLTVTNEYPTKNMTVEFDFEDVRSYMREPHAQLLFTNTTKVNKISDSPTSLKYTHQGWVSPKNGVAFVWWRQ